MLVPEKALPIRFCGAGLEGSTGSGSGSTGLGSGSGSTGLGSGSGSTGVFESGSVLASLVEPPPPPHALRAQDKKPAKIKNFTKFKTTFLNTKKALGDNGHFNVTEC